MGLVLGAGKCVHPAQGSDIGSGFSGPEHEARDAAQVWLDHQAGPLACGRLPCAAVQSLLQHEVSFNDDQVVASSGKAVTPGPLTIFTAAFMVVATTRIDAGCGQPLSADHSEAMVRMRSSSSCAMGEPASVPATEAL
jgi:hypothetical protein